MADFEVLVGMQRNAIVRVEGAQDRDSAVLEARKLLEEGWSPLIEHDAGMGVEVLSVIEISETSQDFSS